ncbi:Na+/H+ antiporter NhaA [Campylobacter sp. MIT 12-8780]|uniref:Na+/H+ antiporter NhaA n=1 Tax=unclassified Campylobacter TaxID=2593542 RepID=UPI00115EA204|nr:MULTISPECIES: Na+/H+ antiporter NhaA [unclassified Campylobacter]NDJ27233.1 Na+/H+ antiporter NhaA [Campylobacter sp. MIT 19-121]TQR41475.1 Na+/H+ antiporter NhaA [Campylobacter sp. MIT 12-8780]
MQALKNFVKNEAFAGVLLIIATLLALWIENGSYQGAYKNFLSLEVGFKAGEFGLFKPFLLWINDGLIAIFFFSIGLELKKEFTQGDFKNPKNITLPLFGAIGGIIVPALIFALINFNNPYALRGWAIPTATDTAFALAILLMCGKHLPASLKIFLLSLAIFDDVGAILIIAIFYTSKLSVFALVIAMLTICALLVLNLLKITRKSFYFICSLILWISVLKSGVHATLAGLVTAFFIPLYTKDGEPFLEEIYEGLKAWLGFVILPLFAFANAGVNLSKIDFSSFFSGVSLGIFLGLFVGKQVGVFAFSYFSIKLKLTKLPEGATFKQLYGVCILTGIGFTMSLFIDGLAYEVSDIFNYADNFAILLASLCSGIFGFVYLRFFAKS